MRTKRLLSADEVCWEREKWTSTHIQSWRSVLWSCVSETGSSVCVCECVYVCLSLGCFCIWVHYWCDIIAFSLPPPPPLSLPPSFSQTSSLQLSFFVSSLSLSICFNVIHWNNKNSYIWIAKSGRLDWCWYMGNGNDLQYALCNTLFSKCKYKIIWRCFTILFQSFYLKNFTFNWMCTCHFFVIFVKFTSNFEWNFLHHFFCV